MKSAILVCLAFANLTNYRSLSLLYTHNKIIKTNIKKCDQNLKKFDTHSWFHQIKVSEFHEAVFQQHPSLADSTITFNVFQQPSYTGSHIYFLYFLQ